MPGNLYDPSQSRFGEIDRTGYDAVAGNPPYIRAERSSDIETHTEEYFTSTRTRGTAVFKGVSIGGNAYSLFIYRALDHWCRQPGEDGPVGRLGFIVPLALCGSNETADLRALFGPGARWAIREIVDMELIWSEIFDADVLPMILIAEAAPAASNDLVSIRLADDTCIKKTDGAKRPTFEFDHLPEQKVRYADLFTPDGRIMTRMTPERVAILAKLRGNASFSDAAMPYWTKRSRGPQQVVSVQPTGFGSSDWEPQRLIRYGIATRREVHEASSGGYVIYKGENITATQIVGEPIHANLDVTRVSSASIWAFPHILPSTVYALPLIEQTPVAAPFDPAKIAVLNTVVVFGPRSDLTTVPFDVLLLSNIYSWFYVLGGRRSFQNKIRSHIYPTAVAELPWNEALASHAQALIEIRTDLLALCEKRYEQVSGFRTNAETLGLTPLKDVVRDRTDAKIAMVGDFKSAPKFSLHTGVVTHEEDGWALPLDEADEHRIIFNNEELANLASAGLALLDGEEVSRTSILNAAIPVDASMAVQLAALRASYEPDGLDIDIDKEIGKLDAIVGPALGLSVADVEAIQKEMTGDPFLSRVQPRYPFRRPRQYGRRVNLERENRYMTV